MAWLSEVMALSPGEIAFAAIAVFFAGVVRGFSGFALSAMVMASLVFVIDPKAIIPICLVLEIVATILLTRGGAAEEADRPMVYGLIFGVLAGFPLGLLVTINVADETSRVLALGIILTLAVAQLSGFRPRFLATRAGLVGSGVAAGVVQGTAAAGGMVIALYALARNAPVGVMRASLVFYLSITIVLHSIILTAFGLLTELALIRGLLLAAPAAAGVLLGAWLFSPRLQPYYRRACLSLLSGLAAVGIARIALR